ncbi:uncharacterized protein LOC132473902 isoform X15 [Gadus macrocephalus]|uniref:uncharacterized protein LOC132473902 isoform X15 n=1 Tax=Gadus macrocephalus TaxID=80720 RepID=UPI0028CB13A7|nr:uncharacterized protein LOC132473902 isoform X15 [Gadus macrocephalus]
MSSSCLCSCLHPASVFMSSSCLCSCLHPASVHVFILPLFMSSPCLCSCLHPASVFMSSSCLCSCLHPASVLMSSPRLCSCLHPASVHVFTLPLFMSSPCLCSCLHPTSLFMSSPYLSVHVFILPLFMSSSCLCSCLHPASVHVFILPLFMSSSCLCSCYLPAAPAYFYRFYGVFSWKARRSLACLAPMPHAGSPPPPFGGHPRVPGSRRGHRLLPLVFGWRLQQLSLGVRSVVPEQAQMFPDVPSLEAALGHSREKEGTSSELRVPLGLQRREKKGSASHGDHPGRPVTVGLVTRQMIRPVQWRSDQYSGGQTQYSGGQTSTVEVRPVQWRSDPVQWRSDQYSGGQTSTVEVRPRPASFPPEELSAVPQTCGGPGPTHWFVGSAAAGAAGVCV